MKGMTDGNEVEDKSTTISTKSSKQSTLPAYYNYPKSKNGNFYFRF